MDTQDAVRSVDAGETARAGVAEPTKKTNGISAVWHVALTALALALIVFWYTPAVLYSNNEQQFRYPLLQVLPLLGILLVATVIVLPLPVLLMPRRARRVYASVLAALVVSVWVRGFFLVEDYGLLDGAISLPEFSFGGLVVSIAIVIVVAAVLFLARIPSRIFVGAVIALLVAMLAHIGVVVLQDPNPVRSLEPATVDPLYSFGRENLLIILLDSLQSDVFAETIRERPDLAEALDGFTYYPNTLGVAPSTYGSMPTVHSSRLHTPGQSMSEHFNTSIREHSFLNEFAADDWYVTHMNPIGTICPERVQSCFVYDTTAITSGRTRLTQQGAELLDLSLFRLAPPELKRTVYNDDRWRVRKAFKTVSIQESSDTALVDITANARVDSAKKTVKFLHLQNTHPPATRAADCSLLPKPISPITRPVAVDLTECALTRVGALVEKLKTLGIYDKTSIVMFADTGWKGLGGNRVTSEPEWTGPRNTTAASWKELIGLANPFMAVKPPGATAPFATSDAELSLAEMRTIACSLTGGCGDEPADWDSPPPDRVRHYLLYQWHDRFWHAPALKNERRFEIRGRMVDPASWHEVGRITLPVVSNVTFGRADHVGHFGNGWGPVRADGDGARWGVGEHAAMFLRLPNDAGARLTFDVESLPELEDQSIFVKVNLHPLGDPVKIDRVKHTISFDVPRWATDDKEIDEVLLFFGQHREGTHPNRHIRLQESLAVRFHDLRIEFVR